jgi:hypothetical protein
MEKMLVRFATIAVLAMLWLVPVADADEPRRFPMSEQETEKLLQEKNFARGDFYFAFAGLWAMAWVEIPPGLLPGETPTTVTPAQTLNRHTGGFDMRLGYRSNRWFASELSGLYLHDFGQRNITFLTWGMWGSQRFYFTRNRIQPYATIGLGFAQLRATGNYTYTRLKFTPLVGVGVEVYQTETIAYTLVGNFYIPVATDNSVYFASAGLGMIFY